MALTRTVGHVNMCRGPVLRWTPSQVPKVKAGTHTNQTGDACLNMACETSICLAHVSFPLCFSMQLCRGLPGRAYSTTNHSVYRLDKSVSSTGLTKKCIHIMPNMRAQKRSRCFASTSGVRDINVRDKLLFSRHCMKLCTFHCRRSARAMGHQDAV